MKIFKKTVAAVSAVSLLASMAVVPMSAGAATETEVYKQDFTGITDASTVATSANAQEKLTIADEDGYDDYLSFSFSGDSSTNSRGAYMDFTGLDASALSRYNVEFDASISIGTGRPESTTIAIKSTDVAYNNGNVNYGLASGYIMSLVLGTDGTATINGTSIGTFPAGQWCHYTLACDNAAGTVTTTITNGTTVVADAVTTEYNGNGIMSGLYLRSGRYGATQKVDNIVVTSIDTEGEALESIAFDSFPSGNTLVAGADENTAQSNPISVKLTGSEGSDLTANYDKYTVEYKLKGFRWIADKNEASTDAENSDTYCDSYGELLVDETTHTADFKLKKHAFNYYGAVEATVTYGSTTLTVEKPLVYLGNTSNQDANTIFPKGGYVEDFSSYSDDMVGYTCLSETYGAERDLILGGFCLAGSDSAKSAVFTKEGTDKFIRISKGTVKKSGVLTNVISAPASQIIMEQDIRFNSTGGCITLTQGYPFWSNTRYSEALTLSFNGSAITLNGSSLTNGDNAATFSSGTWYNVIVSADKTTETAYAQVYDSTGKTLLGAVSDVAWVSSCNPTYYSIGLGNSNTGTIDLGSYHVYYPTMDSTKFTLTAENTTLSIPDAQSTTLTASAFTADGYPVTGVAEWTIADESMAEGVTITPDSVNSHKATVGVSSTAVAGTLPIQVTIGGYSKTIELTLTSSDDSVKFTKSETSVTIPLEATAVATATFAAEVIDANAQKLSDCTLAVYDKTNTTQLITLPAGISFNNGVLSVASNAQPITLTIRATGTNSAGDTISKAVKVIVHGFSFDFGEGTDADVVEGYTAVSPSTTYTSKLGYGIEGTATAAGTASTTDASADYLTGTFTFKANVENNKIYTVNVYYSGSAASEYVNSDLSGVALSNSSMSVATYNIPVFDGVLDLAFADSNVSYITISKQADKAARTKPNVFSIGDSTAANNGSWAYRLNSTQSNYSALSAVATFSNNGRGSRNLCSYYTEGMFRSVLNSIQPGDYVMIGCMGTNGTGSYFETDLNYYIDCCKALGANVILNSYTPHGCVGNWAGYYDSNTQTFESYRRDSYDVTLRAVYAERSDELAGFIDIGKNADASFNAYVDAYAANGYASRDAAAQAIIACFPDHNHYNSDSLACVLMLEGYNGTKGIVSELVRIIGENTVVPELAAITTEALAIADEEGSVPAKGYKAEFVQGDDNLQPTKLVWNITSTLGSAKKNPEVAINTTISGGATVRYGLVITGTVEQLESLTVEAELK